MKLVPVVALALLVASPAFAGQMKKNRPHMQQSYHQMQPGWRGSHAQYRGNYIRGPNVYSPEGRYVGRDPSLNVRQNMYDTDIKLRGGL